ncbi:MAG: LysR substrate-binding domain-containing protein [Cyanophyceae cyanobacterium]
MIEDIAKKAQSARGLQGRQVRVASFRSVDTHILPRIIARFRQAFPQIDVTISECEYYEEVEDVLRSNLADIGFTYLPTAIIFKKPFSRVDAFYKLTN